MINIILVRFDDRYQLPRKLTEITEEMFRSTAWYGKKVMVGTIEYDVITVYNLSQDFELFAKGYGKTTKDYSQCKLIEE